MDFDSLTRRDLQFFCKKNKIPANMTNLAMSDALKSLEIVEGIEEFLNQSPTSVAKNLPSIARTTARRKTKDETQPSELVTRSCYVSIKSLAGEMEQENRDTNVLKNPSREETVTSIAMDLDMKTETPAAARSTRRAQVAASTKKDESVQRVYSTRRSVRLLEESMAELCLKTKESATKTDESVTTGLVAEEPKELESDYSSEEEDSSVSDKETMDSDQETKTPTKSMFEAGSISNAKELAPENNKMNKDNAEEELVGNNNGECKTEGEAKKKSLKDISLRQLEKMVRELAIKNKQQQHKCLE